MKTRVFITGGSGFLGSGLVSKLQKKYDVILLQHQKKIHRKNKGNFSVVNGSIEDVGRWQRNLKGVDVIIHLAGVTHSKNQNDYFEINTYSSEKLIDAAKQYSIKQFVYISTRAIGVNSGPYGKSKKLAEEIIKKSGITYTILRVAEVFDDKGGEGLSNLIKLIDKSLIVPYPNVKSTLAPIYKQDVEDIILATILNNHTYFKTYTVAGSENLSLREVINRIVAGRKRLLIPIPPHLYKQAIIFASFFKKKLAADQIERLASNKKPLSTEVVNDLKIKPRRFMQI